MITFLESRSLYRLRAKHVCISLFIFINVLSAAELSGQSKCETALAVATNMYAVGRTGECILLFSRCLPDELPEVERAQAYKILALAYLAEDFCDKAKLAIEKFLDLNENFEPDYANDPKKFVDIVETSKKTRAKKKSRKKRWLIIGGSTVVAGIIAGIVANTGGASAPRLPDPPNFPDDQ